MKWLYTRWILVGILLLLPQIVLLIVGTLWLYEHGLLVAWLAGGGVLTLMGWGLARWLRRKRLSPVAPKVEPAPNWPPAGNAAFEEVDALAERVENENPPLDRPEALGALLLEVLETVARHYHPNARRAVLEVPAPYVLRVVELVAFDLRKAFSEYLPWSHVLTLGDFLRLKRLVAWARDLYFVYRVARVGIHPMAALLREIREMAQGRVQDTSADSVKRWAVGYCVRRAGYYAIQLYGGHLVLDDVAFSTYQTPQSKQDARDAGIEADRLAAEPLRILVAGQAKSGKSSLINALFGEVRAAVDVLPATRNVQPYVLEREGLPQAILLDTCGYEAVEGPKDSSAPVGELILDSDLVLLVCSAQSAARASDRHLLDAVRQTFREKPNRSMPPLVVALTHVDRLRPLGEWDPPYDLASPSGGKEAKTQQMIEAVGAVEADLALAPEEVVVPVCLKPGMEYNVDEGIAAVILQSVSQAQRVRYLRCLRHYREEDQWQRLWQQAVNSGRVLFKAGAEWMRRR